MAVLPATAVVGNADSLAFAFRNANRGPFNEGSQLELSIPAGWTTPQASNPSAAGYVKVASISGTATASIASISGSGPWTVLVAFSAAKGTGHGFDLAYGDAAPSAAGAHAFAVRTRQAGRSFVAIGASPSITAVKAQAGVTLGNLAQTFDGNPRVVEVSTLPAGLTVAVTYDGQPLAPTAVGAYAVVATVVDASYEGSASGTLVVQEAGGGEPTIGLETFNYFNYTGSTYASGAFLGQDGSTWTYSQARGDLSISGRSPTLAKAKNSTLRSGAIPGGVGVLSVKFRKADTQNVRCDVYVGQTLAGTISGRDGTVQTWTSGELNVQGEVVLTFSNNVNNGSITLDDVAWTSSKIPATVALDGLAQTYDGTDRAVTATTIPAGLAVDITYDGSDVAPAAAGTYAVVAAVADANYAGSVSGTLVVAKADQTVDFPAMEDQLANAALEIDATASSGLPVDLAVASGPAVIAGTQLTFTGAGPVSVVASQAGDANWNPAPAVTCTFGVTKAVAGLTLDNLNPTYDGTPRPVAASTTPADLAVDLTYDGNEMPPVAAGSYAVAAAINDARYAGSASATLVVAQAAATISLGDLARTYDGLPKPASATTDPAGLTVDVAYDGSEIAPTDAGTYAVVATVADANYVGAANGALVVAKAGQTIDFPAIDDQRTTNVVVLAATASSGLPVAFAVASGPAVLVGTQLTFAGTGIVSIVASQAGDANWNPAPAATGAFNVRLPPVAPETSVPTVNVREAGEARFFVRLNRAPTGNVVVAVSWAGGSETMTVKSGATLAFGPLNWDWWQAVTLAASGDANGENDAATFRISLPDGPDRFVTATALDDDIGENLALASRGSEITGDRAFRCSQANDGISASLSNYGYTIWTDAPQGTMTLNLKAMTTVSRIRLLNWDWLYPVLHRYLIESSLDGVNWSILVDASAEDHSGWDEWPVAGQVARYLRFTGLSNSANAAVCIPEWEVYGVRDPLPQPVLSRTNVNVHELGDGRFFVRLDRAPDGDAVVVDVSRSAGEANVRVKCGAPLTFTPSNWSEWQVVTLAANEDVNADNETATFRISTPGVPDRFVGATVLDDDIGENLALASSGTTISGSGAGREGEAIDGEHVHCTNYAFTVWTSTPPGTLTMDLHALSTLSRVRLLSWNWTPRAQQYRIETSRDGAAWTLLANACTDGRCGWEDWDAAGLRARYLRLTGISSTVDEAVRFAEWEVYGIRIPPPRPEIASKRVNVREAGEGRIFIRLNSAPEEPVAVKVSRSAGSKNVKVKNGAVLAFTPANWDLWQAVTLAASEDDNADSETATFQVSLPGTSDQYVEATTLDDDIGDNWALASSGSTIRYTVGYRPSQLIDGVHLSSANYGYTTWSNSIGYPRGTMTLDLNAATALSRMRLLNYDWSYRPNQYQIESSLDGTNWMPLVDASRGEHSGWEDWDVSGQSARYLRFTGLSNSVNFAVIVAEWEVYGTRSVEKQSLAPAADKPDASAPAGTVETESEPVSVLTSDGAEDETGWNALDGDDATAWVGQKVGGGYVVVEYAPALTLSGLEVDLAEGSLADVQGLYSLDAKEWQPLPDDLESNPVSLRYLWLVFPDDGTDAVPQVLEIVPNP